jgi:microcystin-dependent protein
MDDSSNISVFGQKTYFNEKITAFAEIESPTVKAASITATDSFIGNGTIPIGGIIMWSGTIANIPTGWALCNGSNGTPDLRNRFIVAAGTDTANVWGFNVTTGTQTFTNSQSYVGIGSTGGSIAHKLTVAELASHFHQDPTWNGAGGGYELPTTGSNFDYGAQSAPTTSTGNDNFHENRPPYYALAFIMRVV